MGNRLYVGNLDYSTTETNLSELFGAVGEVVSVSLVTDRMTGRSKGFAFVEMADHTTAQAAIEQLNGQAVGERMIKVDEARPRRERGSSGGYGGGGGGGHGGGRSRRY